MKGGQYIHMYRRKHSRRNLLLRYGRKPLLLTLALLVTLSGAIGGTLAWLVDTTAPITNTFTVGDISITLTETDTNADGDSDPTTNAYEISPGKDIVKDPLVTVLSGSKDCFVFVRLEEKNAFASFLSYEIADGWTALGTSYPGVYYRKYTASAQAEYPVLKDNKVHCLDSVTKEQLGVLTPATYPQLVIYAYAVQRDEAIDAISSAEKAWLLHQDYIAPLTQPASVQPANLTSVDAPLTPEEQQQLAWLDFAN